MTPPCVSTASISSCVARFAWRAYWLLCGGMTRSRRRGPYPPGPAAATATPDAAALCVVRGVNGKDVAQVPLTEDQHPVGDLGPDRQHEAFGETVRPRT